MAILGVVTVVAAGKSHKRSLEMVTVYVTGESSSRFYPFSQLFKVVAVANICYSCGSCSSQYML